jgi:hypothetical protein
MLTPTEAIFGFTAWLTTRNEITRMSVADDCSSIVPLIIKFCDANHLPERVTDNWPANLIIPKENNVVNFKKRPNNIEVFKITKEVITDMDGLPAWLLDGSLFSKDQKKDNCLFVRLKNGDVKTVYENEYIAKREDGHLFIINDINLHKEYIPYIPKDTYNGCSNSIYYDE